VSDPPKSNDTCDVCGGTVVQRADDTPEAVAKRLDLYDMETAPLVDRYAREGVVIRVDGDRSIEEVTESIVEAIQSRAAVAAPSGR
jgi:adenylate kinase